MQGISYNSLFPKSIWIHLCMLVKLVSIIIVHTFQFVRQTNKYLSSGSDCTLWMTSNSMLLYCQRGTMTSVALCFWYTLFFYYLLEEVKVVIVSGRIASFIWFHCSTWKSLSLNTSTGFTCPVFPDTNVILIHTSEKLLKQHACNLLIHY